MYICNGYGYICIYITDMEIRRYIYVQLAWICSFPVYIMVSDVQSQHVLMTYLTHIKTMIIPIL